jgi:hypothetical protein
MLEVVLEAGALRNVLADEAALLQGLQRLRELRQGRQLQHRVLMEVVLKLGDPTGCEARFIDGPHAVLGARVGRGFEA